MVYRKIILNIPHDSSVMLYAEAWKDKAALEHDIDEWTDWHTAQLFHSENPNIKSVRFPYSRFTCDVEKLIDDSATFGPPLKSPFGRHQRPAIQFGEPKEIENFGRFVFLL